jgi:phosphinothricin acetyltransferase
VNLIRCTHAQADEILAIYNDAILNSTALYEYKPRTRETIQAWFENKAKSNYPVVGIVSDSGELMGFGSYGAFRAFPAYKYTVEHSVYVAAKFRGRGLGRRLLHEVVSCAKAQGYHTLIGVIDSQNAVSIALHENLGFQPAGTVRQSGFKFGRWLDIVLYQLILETPENPMDG